MDERMFEKLFYIGASFLKVKFVVVECHTVAISTDKQSKFYVDRVKIVTILYYITAI